MRRQCLDHLLILNQAHVRRVLSVYLAHHNQARSHQSVEQRTPLPTME
jgi:putative transposase